MPVSETKRRNNDKYNAKCDRIVLQPLKSEGAEIRAAAMAAGKSLQGYALDAIRERMQRDAARSGQLAKDSTAPARTPARE